MIIILNFGSQFAHLIARRVRDLGVKAEILPFDISAENIKILNPDGIILSGGPASVLEKGSPRPDKKIYELNLPLLGICYGHQVMAQMLGGKVKKGKHREFGRETISIKKYNNLFSGLRQKEIVWFSHGDQVGKMPANFINIASTSTCPYAGYRHREKPFYGIQFHPEVTHTKKGNKILANFIFSICKAKKDWGVRLVAAEIISNLKRQIGKNHVIVGISGGVDSLVAATLLRRAIGKQLHAVFVDTGLLREGEVESVSKLLHNRGFHLYVVNAKHLFLGRLKGVTDPERKREIIGHTFIEVFEKVIHSKLRKFSIVSRKLNISGVPPVIKYFAQGTIYPDRIESAATSKNASKIKSHHNLTLPEKLHFKIIEPVKDLYKDEVRKIGVLLGLPRAMLWRHPFPGPGLAIRIIGEVTKERLQILRKADSIFIEELKKANEYEKIWQAFAVLLPIKTVGVMGDVRTYEYIISLRAVDSVDGMTADWHKIPPELLEKISSSIVGKVRGVNRILYDITQKPPSTIEYE